MRISRRMGICAWQGFGQNSFTYTGKSRFTDEGSGNWRLDARRGRDGAFRDGGKPRRGGRVHLLPDDGGVS